MQMTGHKRRSFFGGYNIVSEGDLDAAARRLNEIQLEGKDFQVRLARRMTMVHTILGSGRCLTWMGDL